MKITPENFKRFEKQIILKKIGLWGQKKILSSNVLIIGAGGLGCPLMTYLAASGVGKIGIVDFDKVEICLVFEILGFLVFGNPPFFVDVGEFPKVLALLLFVRVAPVEFKLHGKHSFFHTAGK